MGAWAFDVSFQNLPCFLVKPVTTAARWAAEEEGLETPCGEPRRMPLGSVCFVTDIKPNPKEDVSRDTDPADVLLCVSSKSGGAALATAADPPQLGSAQKKKKKKKKLFRRDQASLPGCPCFPFSYFNVWGEWQATDGGDQIDVIALDDPLPFPTPFWKLHPRKAIAGDSTTVDSAARGPGPLPGLVNAGPARPGGKRLPAPSLPRRSAHRGPSGSCTPSRSRWKPGCRGAPRRQDSPPKHLSGLAESEGCPAERGQRKALGGQQNWNESSHSAVGRKQPHRAQRWILLEGNRVMDYGPGQAQPSPAQPGAGSAAA
ncbi:PREDICTED: uncharacterized protein LOC107182976 [Myotis davidii]|uniref:uncharacterized protein LOC107182976 n=1 Tax=Myotis davidii TaxID=225400 RepID=UPI0007675F5C|nr:PREDICTED: uncharacterized protein LOC107182976 [Myotis davidii]